MKKNEERGEIHFKNTVFYVLKIDYFDVMKKKLATLKINFQIFWKSTDPPPLDRAF